ncbi:claudin-8-like [Hyperolius riggenbachi]|uniref:claudin-8-like n=1 Tax=Hyperolius riggenbachi TaxID=752182 RepID=UPI0035A35683
MVPCVVQSIGMILGVTGMFLTFAVCLMPQWRVSAIAEGTSYGKRIDGQWISRMDGLWVTCVKQSHAPMSCNPYSTSLSLTPDLKAAKILMTFAVLAVVGGVFLGIFGLLFNKCFANNKSNAENRNCLILLSGITYILTGLLILAPVTIVAINIWRNVCFSTCKNVQQQEIGEAVMLGWPTALLLFIAGSIFCWYHPSKCTIQGGASSSVECEPIPVPRSCPEERPLARDLRMFQSNRRNNEDLVF